MKNILACIVIASVMTLSVKAELPLKSVMSISAVQVASKGVEKAVAWCCRCIRTVDKDAGTVTLTGPDKAAVQKSRQRPRGCRLFRKEQ